MRVIVPLQGVVQGRGGLFLGSVIPCALFYFLQLYLKRNRDDPTDPDDPNSSSSSPAPRTGSPVSSPSDSAKQSIELTGLPRSLYRSLSSPRNPGGPICVSGRASSIAKSSETPYYVGSKRVKDDPYDVVHNPDGVIQLASCRNRVGVARLLFLLFGSVYYW